MNPSILLKQHQQQQEPIYRRRHRLPVKASEVASKPEAVDPVHDDRDRAYRMVGDPSDRYSDYDVCDRLDPYPYTVAGASVVVPGPDEAKVDPDPTAVNPAAIDPVAS